MAEPHRVQLLALLEQLADDVDADLGASLYMDDGDGVLALVASTVAQQQASRDLLSWLRRSRPETRGSMLVLSVPDRQGGILIVERSAQQEFSHHDRALARLRARAMADDVAISTGQLRGGIWTRQLEAVQRIAARLTRLASAEQVAAAVCAETRRVIDYDEAHLLLCSDRDEAVAAAVVGAPTGADGRPLALRAAEAASGAIAAVLKHGRPLRLESVRLGPGRPGEWSLMVVPIAYEHETYGLICLAKRGAAGFDDSHNQVLQVIADQAAVAVENARLLARRDALVAALEVLLEVSQAAARASGERQLGDELAGMMRRAMKVDACVISRRDEGSTVLRTLGRDGIDGPDLIADSADLPTRRAVLTDGRARVVHVNEPDDAPEEAAALSAVGARTSVLLPLSAAGPPLGLIELISFSQRQFSTSEMSFLETMTGLATAGLERVRLLEQLRLAADIDPLTGVNNQRYLRSRLRQEVARAARSGSPLSVVMLDLDAFKPINDRHGHAEGDRLLQRIANTIRGQVRTADIVARYGGDEFAVIMPDTTPERARVVTRRVVKSVRGEGHQLSDGSVAHVGVSAGLASFPADGRTAAALLSAADTAMYAAKRSRRGTALASDLERDGLAASAAS